MSEANASKQSLWDDSRLVFRRLFLFLTFLMCNLKGSHMKAIGKLAVRILPDNPNHHIWNNNGVLWCHFTVHHADFTKQRLRVGNVLPACKWRNGFLKILRTENNGSIRYLEGRAVLRAGANN